MADFIDDAQAVNELHQRVSLMNQQVKMQPEKHPDFDGKHCVDCGVKIPKERLAFGRVRCADCQEYKERAEAARLRNGREE